MILSEELNDIKWGIEMLEKVHANYVIYSISQTSEKKRRI